MAMMVVKVHDLEHQDNKHIGPKSVKSNAERPRDAIGPSPDGRRSGEGR
jgi:hypothetical protein